MHSFQKTRYAFFFLVLLVVMGYSAQSAMAINLGPITDAGKLLDAIRGVMKDRHKKQPGGAAAQLLQGHPRLADIEYATDDIPIISWVVTDPPYNADPTGMKDSSPAFQKALDDAEQAGGGVVFAPAGKYRMDSPLTLGHSVILRGDWKRPSEGDPAVKGTVLMVYAGKGAEDGVPFIHLTDGSAICNLSIYYPEQSAVNPLPYPWTVQQTAGDTASIINVTLVNPWMGIRFGVNANELHFVRDLYGCPLKVGIHMDRIYDVGRLQAIHFAPVFWSGSGLPASPDLKKVRHVTLQSPGLTGIEVGYNDWEVMNDIHLDSCAIGIHFLNDGGDSNGNIYNLQITHAETGIQFDFINPYGWSISYSRIDASANKNSACIRTGAGFKRVSSQFNHCLFTGQNGVEMSSESNGLLSFVDCDFRMKKGASAIQANSGSLIVHGCSFDSTPHIPEIALGASIQSAVITDNGCSGVLKVEGADQRNVDAERNNNRAIWHNIDPVLHAPHPAPQSDQVLVATDAPFYAARNGESDATLAIQEALNIAGKLQGGATVYLPAGRYLITGHLTVPIGVELRGVNDAPHHTTAMGTILFAQPSGDRGLTDGIPLIRLLSNGKMGSGVRGLTVWYSKQDPDNIAQYPWTIRSEGARCWLVDVNLPNSYQGVDFGTFRNDGHVIDYLSGAVLKTMLFVGNSSGGGWVENCHFNPHFWARSPGYNGPTAASSQNIWPWQKANGVAFLFGDCKQENVCGTFVFGSHVGVKLIKQADGTGFEGNIIGHGTDGSPIGVEVQNAGPLGVRFINYQGVSFDNGNFARIDSSVSPKSPIRFINCNQWTSPDAGYLIEGGDVLLQQCHFADGGTSIVAIGGNVNVEANFFQKGEKEDITADVGAVVRAVSCVGQGGVNCSPGVIIRNCVQR
jgi:hypothetical protein